MFSILRPQFSALLLVCQGAYTRAQQTVRWSATTLAFAPLALFPYNALRRLASSARATISVSTRVAAWSAVALLAFFFSALLRRSALLSHGAKQIGRPPHEKPRHDRGTSHDASVQRSSSRTLSHVHSTTIESRLHDLPTLSISSGLRDGLPTAVLLSAYRYAYHCVKPVISVTLIGIGAGTLIVEHLGGTRVTIRAIAAKTLPRKVAPLEQPLPSPPYCGGGVLHPSEEEEEDDQVFDLPHCPTDGTLVEGLVRTASPSSHTDSIAELDPDRTLLDGPDVPSSVRSIKTVSFSGSDSPSTAGTSTEPRPLALSPSPTSASPRKPGKWFLTFPRKRTTSSVTTSDASFFHPRSSSHSHSHSHSLSAKDGAKDDAKHDTATRPSPARAAVVRRTRVVSAPALPDALADDGGKARRRVSRKLIKPRHEQVAEEEEESAPKRRSRVVSEAVKSVKEFVLDLRGHPKVV